MSSCEGTATVCDTDFKSERADLKAVTEVAQRVSSQMATAAVSLDRCSVPNRGKQESLAFDELEYGMG